MDGLITPTFSLLTIITGVSFGFVLVGILFYVRENMHFLSPKQTDRKLIYENIVISSLIFFLLILILIVVFQSMANFGAAEPSRSSYIVYKYIKSKTVFDLALGLLLGAMIRVLWNVEHCLYPYNKKIQSLNYSFFKYGNFRIKIRLHSIVVGALLVVSVISVGHTFFNNVTQIGFSGVNISLGRPMVENTTRVTVKEGLGNRSLKSYNKFDPESLVGDLDYFLNSGVMRNYEMSVFLALTDKKKDEAADRLTPAEAAFKSYVEDEFLPLFAESSLLRNFGKCLVWFRYASKSEELSQFRFHRFFSINAFSGRKTNIGNKLPVDPKLHYVEYLREQLDIELMEVSRLIELYSMTQDTKRSNNSAETIKKLAEYCDFIEDTGRGKLIDQIIRWKKNIGGSDYVYSSLLMRKWLSFFGFEAAARDELLFWLNSSGTQSITADYGVSSWNIDKALFELLSMYRTDEYEGLVLSRLLMKRLKARLAHHPQLIALNEWVNNCRVYEKSDIKAKTYLLVYMSALGDYIERRVEIAETHFDENLDLSLLINAEQLVSMDDRCYLRLFGRKQDKQYVDNSVALFRAKFNEIYGTLILALIDQGNVFVNDSDEIITQNRKAVVALGVAEKYWLKKLSITNTRNDEAISKSNIPVIDRVAHGMLANIHQWNDRAKANFKAGSEIR